MKTRLLALAFASCALLPAQDKASPYRFVPADANFVVRFAAPAKWKKQFETTQVKKLFSTPALEPLVKMASQGIDEALESLRSSGAFDADLVAKLLESYTGDVVFAASLDVDGIPQAIANDMPPHFGVVIALTPDGSYDFAKLAAAIEKAAEKGGEFRDLQVGDHRLRATTNEDEPDVTLPAVIDGNLVMFASDDLAKFAARAAGTAARFAAPAGDPALFAHVDLGAFIKVIGTVANAVGAVPFDLEQVMQGVLGSPDTATLTVGAEGKQLAMGVTIAFREGDRGIFGMLAPGKGTAKLLRYVPPNAETFSVQMVDFNALYDTVGKVWKAFGDEVPLTWEKALDAAKENLKVRVKEDLLDHLGGEVLSVQDVAAAFAGAAEVGDPTATFAGTCLAVALRDGKAFGTSVETALRARGLHAGRKTEEYQGQQVHRLKIAGVFELEYAIADDLLVVGLGSSDASHKALRSVLDARANPAATAELPASVKARVPAIAADWSGISVSAMGAAIPAVVSAFEMGVHRELDEIPPPLQMVLDSVRKLGGEFERLGLQTIVATMRVTSRTIEAQYRW